MAPSDCGGQALKRRFGAGVDNRSLQGALTAREELVELLDLFLGEQGTHPVAGIEFDQTAGHVVMTGPCEERQRHGGDGTGPNHHA